MLAHHLPTILAELPVAIGSQSLTNRGHGSGSAGQKDAGGGHRRTQMSDRSLLE